MSKLVAAVSGLLVFFFISLCNGEETAAESKIPSPPLLVCQYVLYVCVLCMRERESEQRDHKRSAAVEVDYEAVKIKQQPSAASFFFAGTSEFICATVRIIK